MNKPVVILVVLLLLCLCGTAPAANLSSDWYVKIGGVAVWGYTPGVDMWGIDWNFIGGLGSYPPFVVTSSDYPPWDRTISVAIPSLGVPAGTEVCLSGAPVAPIPTNGIITSMDFGYQTFYDASQMRLGLYVTHSNGSTELMYSETRSGPISTFGSVNLLPDDVFEFRATAVPEPSSLLILSFQAMSLIGLGWRRMK